MSQELITILAAGDMLLNRQFSDEMLGRKTPCAQKVISEIDKADITFFNLEAPLGTKGYRVAKPGILRAPPAVAEDLCRIGIDVVSLANNHMLDYGFETMFETIDALDNQGIKHAGAGKNLRGYERSCFRN